MMKHFATLFIVFLFPLCVFAQSDVYEWKNPSFEAEPGNGRTPPEWENLFTGSANTPPDIQPGFWGCSRSPFRGQSYVGLVTRWDGSYEGLRQRLLNPLKKDSSYFFTIWVCRSAMYNAPTKVTGSQWVKFDTPIKLSVLGLDKDGAVIETLAESGYVTGSDWMELRLAFRPQKQSYHNIALSAVVEKKSGLYSNGHVLIDFVSPIRQISGEVFLNLDSANFESKIKQEAFKNRNEIVLSNVLFLGNGPQSHMASWDLFVADKNNVSQFLLSTRVSDSISANDIYNLEMEPHFGTEGIYLVGNKNGKWSGVGQKLPFEMSKSKKYTFSLELSNPGPGKLSENIEPLRLKVWGGSLGNPRQEILAKTFGIDNKMPKVFSFILEPTGGDWDYIFMEAHSITDGHTYYSGNVNILNCSSIQLLKNK